MIILQLTDKFSTSLDFMTLSDFFPSYMCSSPLLVALSQVPTHYETTETRHHAVFAHACVCLFAHQLSLVLTVHTHGGMARLSWPGWPVIHRDCLPTLRRWPILVLTVVQLRQSRPTHYNWAKLPSQRNRSTFYFTLTNVLENCYTYTLPLNQSTCYRSIYNASTTLHTSPEDKWFEAQCLIAWCCHLVNLMVLSHGHCPSILKASWRYV